MEAAGEQAAQMRGQLLREVAHLDRPFTDLGVEQVHRRRADEARDVGVGGGS